MLGQKNDKFQRVLKTTTNRNFNYKQGKVSLNFNLDPNNKEDLEDFNFLLDNARVDVKETIHQLEEKQKDDGE